MTERKASCLLFTSDLREVLLRRRIDPVSPYGALTEYVDETESPSGTALRLTIGISEPPYGTYWIGETRIPEYFEDGDSLIAETDWFTGILSKKAIDGIPEWRGQERGDGYEYRVASYESLIGSYSLACVSDAPYFARIAYAYLKKFR